MDAVHYINKSFSKPIDLIKRQLCEFNQNMNAQKRIDGYNKRYNVPKLTPKEDKEVREYFKSKGFYLRNTDWHAFYKDRSGEFHRSYIPRDFFKTKISPKFNQRVQWPALLDKNLYYRLFRGFNQPKRIAQNINGFYYINDKPVSLAKVIETIMANNELLIIKPTLESGAGKMVTAFTSNGDRCSFRDLRIKDLLTLYGKDFIVQEFIKQSKGMSLLNPKSLNAVRVVSYFNDEGVHPLSVNIKIGSKDSYTDNYATGGILCGVDSYGKLRAKGYTKNGSIVNHSTTGIELNGYAVPNYNSVVGMVQSMHLKVPYFKIISWDIGINQDDDPVLIEYNTYNQGFEQQMCNGPLFGKFTDEIFAKALMP